MPSPKTDPSVTSTPEVQLDINYSKNCLFNDSGNVSVNVSPINSSRKRQLDVDDSKNRSFNYSKSSSYNESNNETPITSKTFLSNKTPTVSKTITANETPKLPRESFTTFFTCSTPLSGYKTPSAKKKRLFTPGNSSGYIPVSSPTDSELLRADLDNSDVFLDGSCFQSVDVNSSAGEGEGDRTPLKTILETSELSDCTPLKSILNNSDCKLLESPLKSILYNNDCETPLRSTLKNTVLDGCKSPVKSPLNSSSKNDSRLLHTASKQQFDDNELGYMDTTAKQHFNDRERLDMAVEEQLDNSELDYCRPLETTSEQQ
ncbi:uncharacterized protein LOC111064409 [Nilaparvata lugens]|uniref:uncharacterized protein LOC111064409 n=1 Tax=Nilaparvata lugens TaxID=108931 RepID=UPI000B997072|nr:uncharacterized protein LOC111064409 [Nilaparvata lugens]XP_039292673.1 uncharacterized protein LOC111064409 [Nilaparvata lugens]